MSSNNLIHIQNLSCSYSLQEKDKVLYIQNLSIEKGKIVFLLGASGSGKSTLLETLGLMNNTIATGTLQWYNGNTSVELGQLWKSGNTTEINRIRKEYLSFIFQNTNLMENFTAYENICLSQMIKKNSSQQTVMTGAENLMQQVGLPLSQVGYETLSVNLSGGQRQRISFVRALNNDYKILLCDEPTGNLDEVNARELMKIVKQNLTSESSAVIVSHDVNLALNYADEIILITKNENGYGEILPSHIYPSQHWQNLAPLDLSTFRNSLVAAFNTSKKNTTSEKKSESSSKKISGYKQLFQKKETRVLFGKSSVNLFILSAILSLTFLAVGFANGTLDYLNKKLNDVFVNWVTVMIPSAKGDGGIVEELTEILNADSTRTKFLIDTASAYKETPLPFFSVNTNGVSQQVEFMKGRLINPEDRMVRDLFGPENFLSGSKGFLSESDLGIVVTKKFLETLHYPDSARVVYMEFEKDTSVEPAVYFQVPVVIRAVIKNIPNRNKFLVTEHFFKAYKTDGESVFDFRHDNRKQILYFVEGNKQLAQDLKKEIDNNVSDGKLNLTESFTEKQETDNYISEEDESHEEMESNNTSDTFSNSSPDSLLQTNATIRTHKIEFSTTVDECNFFTAQGFLLRVDLDPSPHSYVTTKNLSMQINSLPLFKTNKDKIIRCIDPNYANASFADDVGKYDYLSVVFKKNGLEKVDSFAADVNKNLNSGKEGDQANVIEIDSAKVQEKKNFQYIANMTMLIAVLLIAFSVLSISLFISNLLKTHLNKIKMNLGTYKAFGLSDHESVNIYMQIMLKFIGVGIGISLVVAFTLGKIVEMLLKSSSMKVEEQSSYFQLLNNSNTYLLLGIIVIVTYVVSFINIKRILSKTPGDLIYNR